MTNIPPPTPAPQLNGSLKLNEEIVTNGKEALEALHGMIQSRPPQERLMLLVHLQQIEKALSHVEEMHKAVYVLLTLDFSQIDSMIETLAMVADYFDLCMPNRGAFESDMDYIKCLTHFDHVKKQQVRRAAARMSKEAVIAKVNELSDLLATFTTDEYKWDFQENPATSMQPPARDNAVPIKEDSEVQGDLAAPDHFA
ncbi:hypothetical protein IE81DRAFT_348199 [Ceraceosorus guamensis]|uniref:Uncharacterized protein n=1 Tax=Ceraceosorus guamensis TaxID=1522189 RepID=A0A316VVW5_9BASI|nr:hypothetical protein IE81DRAFT_348199 [Ceraceosorus guamensis]PWN41630.1 hypothetical protein IE81DRAFT_348199 [Ceraceosorus guamensis]